MSNSVIASFLGALEASLSVLLTIGYGAVAARYNLLKSASARDINKLCVRLFLPALMIANLGDELQAKTAYRYIPVLIWALFYTLASMALGWVLKRMFKFPAWTIPAICFNNTTALPLLLLQSLQTSGILKDLTMGKGDTAEEAMKRAKSYFLVAAVVGNSLTFAVGPRLLDDEETPDSYEDKKAQEEQENGSESEDEHENPTNESGRTAEEQEEHATETTTLLPDRIADPGAELGGVLADTFEKYWSRLPAALRNHLHFVSSFFNAPLIGAVIGAILGLVPPFHKAFFGEPMEGGIFKAWLTSSVKKIGELFPALQLVVVGAKLSASLLKMKEGKDVGKMKLVPVLSIFFIRFILWPVISIGTIYLLASKTSLLDDDPILWFVLMLLPTGPSATKLTALADVSGGSEDDKHAIAKFITLSYAISPLICFTVVGALKASLAAKS
ncbi:related to Auxin Efflux Carrier superfamily [Rhynchosporium secalis]|uniref:Related to Auxin Efflux Carrier superfamily n=1 Tax=Rhynchosporium secalis TaxID=38038 RepID=A0A1E1MGC9_RHYSE|nr:related to Auxin Efflux Carrier superfamily [Rhynchosporium secalis]